MSSWRMSGSSALRRFPSCCVFEAEAERQTDSVTVAEIVLEDNFLGVKMKKATEIWEQNYSQN